MIPFQFFPYNICLSLTELVSKNILDICSSRVTCLTIYSVLTHRGRENFRQMGVNETTNR